MFPSKSQILNLKQNNQEASIWKKNMIAAAGKIKSNR